MKRETVLLVLASTLLGGYWYRSVNEDTILTASNRLSRAMMSNDTKTLWSYVSDDERAYYGLDQAKFDRYWNSIVAPELTKFDSSRFEEASTSGLVVALSSSNLDYQTARFGLIVSGQMGHYYAPNFISRSAIGVGSIGARHIGSQKYRRQEILAQWFTDNKSKLESLGITHMRQSDQGGAGVSLDGLIAFFHKGAEDQKARIALVSR